jgi:hypothetical protein
MRTYRVDSKTVRIEARDDAESIVLEVVRTGLARSRADRNDPPAINSRGPCAADQAVPQVRHKRRALRRDLGRQRPRQPESGGTGSNCPTRGRAVLIRLPARLVIQAAPMGGHAGKIIR